MQAELPLIPSQSSTKFLPRVLEQQPCQPCSSPKSRGWTHSLPQGARWVWEGQNRADLHCFSRCLQIM